jgi:prefoldin subunit 5
MNDLDQLENMTKTIQETVRYIDYLEKKIEELEAKIAAVTTENQELSAGGYLFK